MLDKIIVLNVNNLQKAKRFIQKANMIDSDVFILGENFIIDAKSFLGIYAVNLSHPVTVQIRSYDKDEIKKFNEIMDEFKIK